MEVDGELVLHRLQFRLEVKIKARVLLLAKEKAKLVEEKMAKEPMQDLAEAKKAGPPLKGGPSSPRKAITWGWGPR